VPLTTTSVLGRYIAYGGASCATEFPQLCPCSRIRRECGGSEKSDEFLRFDETFDPTLGMIEPEWSLPMVIFFKRLIKDTSGVTAIEYGLISALIVIGCLAAINSTGLALNLTGTFGRVASSL
jgi:pilus assembly protein Flp/PilA